MKAVMLDMKSCTKGNRVSGITAILLGIILLTASFIVFTESPSALQKTDDTAEISVCKHMMTYSTEDKFIFRLEPVEAWINENSDPSADGMMLEPSEMPMPGDTSTGRMYTDISAEGFSGQTNISKISSFGLIRFSHPGWYMYKVSEIVPQEPQEGLSYDKSIYYTVVYAEYAEDTGNAVRVSNITAWHNGQEGTAILPDLTDISSVTDNRGEPAVDNEDINSRGKTDIGTNTIILDFWNSQDTGSFIITKKVTGSLGDVTKEFEFRAVFSGLAPHAEYHTSNNGAVFADGFSDTSFTTDAEGRADLGFRLRNNTGFSFDGLPAGAVFEITEDISDHDPGYTVKKDDEEIAYETMYTHGALSTGQIEVDGSGNYTVEFINKRNAAPVTGVAENSIWWTGMGLSGIAAAAIAAGYIYACSRGSIRKNGSPTTFS